MPGRKRVDAHPFTISLSMRLYHYTSVALFDGALRTDLSLGHLNMVGEVIKPVAWLATAEATIMKTRGVATDQ
ncbi:hypothetical protein CR105_18555 [Massilia eurypsychrophila]|jgi:hypothetical protein|uniref:Uncharacterized protein n=1 Tax=Massilia eurypsychrophila TaxID=1485217 RepID=A0A2G8TBT7_9BURK|nr:hypothetical protein CR105_18555 [Massilia eurypsychrophila]